MAAEPGVRRRAAVLGHPIAHSLSPVLHRAAYAGLGLDWEYDRIDVSGADLPALLDGLDDTWAGLSLTMPLKLDVLPLLDEIDDVGRATRAVNTVVLRDGRRLGYNTDVAGLVAALGELTASTPPRTGTVLGAGGTGRSAVAALVQLGVRDITLYARRPEAAADVRATAADLGADLLVLPWDAASAALTADVVISTVPAGVSDAWAPLVPDRPGRLLDAIYEPWPTELARAWAQRGGAVASGLDLLLHQAVEQVRLMTGRRPDIGPMRAALMAAADAR
jgi:shikimate dehydrogenase